jgi:hypothetical protein
MEVLTARLSLSVFVRPVVLYRAESPGTFRFLGDFIS